MVDVGDKQVTRRRARAAGSIRMSPEAFGLVERSSGPKGDVLSTAELAGGMAAKRAGGLIPLCHSLTLDHVGVAASLEPGLPGVKVEAAVEATGRTGVEMEALTAVSVALLTVYDMVKASGHDMEVGPVRLLEKSGGASGDWTITDE